MVIFDIPRAQKLPTGFFVPSEFYCPRAVVSFLRYALVPSQGDSRIASIGPKLSLVAGTSPWEMAKKTGFYSPQIVLPPYCS